MYLFEREAKPQRLLYLVLGSAFNQTLETKMGFIQEFQQLGYQVDVISIDSKPLIGEQVKLKLNDCRLTRMSLWLTKETCEALVDNYIKANAYQHIIINDGVHFAETKFSQWLSEAIKATGINIEITIFHYISTSYRYPRFNDSINFEDFDIKFSALLPVERIKPLLKEGMEEKFIKFSSKLDKAPHEHRLNQYDLFLSSQGAKSIFTNPAKIKVLFHKAINSLICNQVNADRLKLMPQELGFEEYSSLNC